MSFTKSTSYDFWQTALNGARFVMAPMVDQSELAWRMLGRRHGIQLCYTPMLHAAVFVRDLAYRRQFFTTCQEDRPLIVQFCGNNPETVLKAAKLVESSCDAIDLNLGCPQSVARRGRYGAFLQDEWDIIHSIVSTLHRELSVPVTCKVRVFEDIDKTVRYAQMLERAGCQLLTVHGRTRDQKGVNTGLASWAHVKAVKENVSIPVFANGNILYLSHVHRCLQETGVDGVMSAEGQLYNPSLFTGDSPYCWEMAEEYLELVEKYPCPLSFTRGHLFKMWQHTLARHPECRHKLAKARSFEELVEASSDLKAAVLRSSLPSDDEDISPGNIPYYRCQPYIRPDILRQQGIMRNLGDEETSDKSEIKRVKIRSERRQNKQVSVERKKYQKWMKCEQCKANPRGRDCSHYLCSSCCKVYCANRVLDCAGHRLIFKSRHEQKQKDLQLIDVCQSDCRDSLCDRKEDNRNDPGEQEITPLASSQTETFSC
ncbi:tRNA-dihydrouridine(16/17) synthase [NAD(P)(+)]-like [Corticium candelabrum]|uniref:tRNA-dihydrouridine(16/17) synthase [NAD(P)(+)]-like n=1 Tax=Corticium candelabrum TaxID=121492 RepID=UPI002E2F3C24|nr:tRNA-dihydrouridine(16/17) synthase [NAD(P)(+)]-like [Corticium candelabrum]